MLCDVHIFVVCVNLFSDALRCDNLSDTGHPGLNYFLHSVQGLEQPQLPGMLVVHNLHWSKSVQNDKNCIHVSFRNDRCDVFKMVAVPYDRLD